MIEKNITITTEFIKLDQLLKLTSVAQTGGHAKELILQGTVLVNQQICQQRGKKLRKGDTITVDKYQFKII